MRKLIATMVVFSILISCSQKEPDQIAQRMHRVENGLVEIKSPADMLRLDSTQLANAKMIIERMEYYKVPGVSIAVINDDRIEWTKVYGTLDVKSGAPVTTETIFDGLRVFLLGEGKDLAFAHPGTNFPGFTSWLIGWPERGTGVVIMTNGI